MEEDINTKAIIDTCNTLIANKEYIKSIDKEGFFEILEHLIKEYKKQEKVINKMAEQLTSPIHNKEWVIEYFTNKVEREDK